MTPYNGRMTFLMEKTGAVEDEFKAAVAPILRRGNAVGAYLCLVEYDENELAVALCIRFADDEKRNETLPEIAGLFKKMFGVDQQLDLIPIGADQELSLKRIAANFVD